MRSHTSFLALDPCIYQHTMCDAVDRGSHEPQASFTVNADALLGSQRQNHARTLPFNHTSKPSSWLERLSVRFLYVFGMIRPGIEPKLAALVACQPHCNVCSQETRLSKHCGISWSHGFRRIFGIFEKLQATFTPGQHAFREEWVVVLQINMFRNSRKAVQVC